MRGNSPRSKNASPYESLTLNEKLAFGRLGLGKAQIQSERDIEAARQMVANTKQVVAKLRHSNQAAVLETFAEGIVEDIASRKLLGSPRKKKTNPDALDDLRLLQGQHQELERRNQELLNQLDQIADIAGCDDPECQEEADELAERLNDILDIAAAGNVAVEEGDY